MTDHRRSPDAVDPTTGRDGRDDGVPWLGIVPGLTLTIILVWFVVMVLVLLGVL